MPTDFEIIAHTADIQIRAYGATLADLFRNALVGMFQSIGPQAPGCSSSNDRLICPQLDRHHEVSLSAKHGEILLVDFLSEALYLSDIHNEAYLDATIAQLTPTHITATLHGIHVTGFDVVEIKAVTYHNLAIKQINGVWQTNIVFDI